VKIEFIIQYFLNISFDISRTVRLVKSREPLIIIVIKFSKINVFYESSETDILLFKNVKIEFIVQHFFTIFKKSQKPLDL
jgi:hypothetical protein